MLGFGSHEGVPSGTHLWEAWSSASSCSLAFAVQGRHFGLPATAPWPVGRRSIRNGPRWLKRSGPAPLPWYGENSRRPLKSCFAIWEGATLPAQRADTIEPRAERWRRLRRHRAALGRRRNISQAPNGALQNMTQVRTLVNTILSMKISQDANIVRNTQRVSSWCAPVGAWMVMGTVYLGRRSAAAPLRSAPGWIVPAPSGRFVSSVCAPHSSNTWRPNVGQTFRLTSAA